MPYKSEAQRRYLHAVHPDIAARWDREYYGDKRDKKRKRAKRSKRLYKS